MTDEAQEPRAVEDEGAKPWAFGYDRFGNERLPDHLFRIARHHSRRAISKSRKSSPEEWLESAVHAGSGLEIFAKFLLSRENPVFILDLKKTQDSALLHAVEKGRGSVKGINLQSRSPESALGLIRMLWPDQTSTIGTREVKRVLDARNAAVHLGILDRAELQGALISFVSIMVELLAIADTKEIEFWGPEKSYLPQLKNAESLHQHLKRKLATARLAANSLKEVNETDVELALEGNSTNILFEDFEYPQGADYWYGEKCPACSRDGRVFCKQWVSEPSDLDADAPFVEVTAEPVEFRCEHCGLELHDSELSLVELPTGERLIDVREATDEELSAYNTYLSEK